MDRRGFMKDVTQVGIGLGVPGLILDAGASTATAADREAAGPQQQGENSRSNENLYAVEPGDPFWMVAGFWLLTRTMWGASRNGSLRPSPEAKPARVPGIFQEVFPAYHGVVWYWREFTPPAHPYAQGRYLLSFGAVDYLAEVWVNGIPIGGHEGSETPFVLDATDAIKPQTSNLLAVRVLKPGDTPIDGYVLKEIPHRNEVVDYAAGQWLRFRRDCGIGRAVADPGGASRGPLRAPRLEDGKYPFASQHPQCHNQQDASSFAVFRGAGRHREDPVGQPP